MKKAAIILLAASLAAGCGGQSKYEKFDQQMQQLQTQLKAQSQGFSQLGCDQAQLHYEQTGDPKAYTYLLDHNC